MSAFSWRCQYCGWAFQMSSEAVASALATADETDARHHVEHCPRCRKALKIPVDQLRRHVPAGVLATPPDLRPVATTKEERIAMSEKPPFPPVGGPKPEPGQPVRPEGQRPPSPPQPPAAPPHPMTPPSPWTPPPPPGPALTPMVSEPKPPAAAPVVSTKRPARKVAKRPAKKAARKAPAKRAAKKAAKNRVPAKKASGRKSAKRSRRK